MVIYMKVIVKKEHNTLNKVIEWLIYMLGYAIVLWITSNIFRSLYIENFWAGLLAAIIIYFLNKTIKPALVTLSLPIIGVTLGLFYFVINVVILLFADILMGKYFDLTGFLSPIFVSLFLSFLNLIMEKVIIKPLIERCKK